MKSFHEQVSEYRKQIEKGTITKAYKGLMEYILDVRTYLKNRYPDYFVSGSIYFGYMDMTYFSFYPKSLGQQKLKIAIVLIHKSMRFEAWLAGYNKLIQSKYWKMFKQSDWHKYRLVSTTKGADSILEHILVEDPDFRDLDKLTRQIERETLKFIKDIESFLSKSNNCSTSDRLATARLISGTKVVHKG